MPPPERPPFPQWPWLPLPCSWPSWEPPGRLQSRRSWALIEWVARARALLPLANEPAASFGQMAFQRGRDRSGLPLRSPALGGH